MRKFIHITALVLVATAFAAFTPGDKGDKPIRYACDDELNDIIVDYYDYFSTISLQEVREYNIDMQRAISRTWSRGQTAKIWQEKLGEDAERFEGKKKVFILKVASSFDNPDWVAPSKEEILQNLTFDEGREVFTTLVRQPKGNGQPPGGNNGNPPSTIAGADCECSQESDWCWGTCSGLQNCSTTTSGCGTFLQYSCTGSCF
jgi:hypothetical protein